MRLKLNKLQDQFEEVGAIRIPNFLSKSDIATIKELYSELKINNLKGIYSNVKDKKPELNYKINETLKSCYKNAIDQHFIDYQIGGGAFLIKGTGEGSESSLHQDWNIVDESQYKSAAIFCPIQDVDEKNGCIQVVKGSHKWFNNIRSFNISSIFLNFNDVEKQLIPFPAKAGDAIVFRHNVFHGSKPNFTNDIRIAASMSIATKNSHLIHYKKSGDNVITFRVNDHFFNEEVQQLYLNKEINIDIIDEKPISEFQILDQKTFANHYKKIKSKGIVNRVKHILFR